MLIPACSDSHNTGYTGGHLDAFEDAKILEGADAWPLDQPCQPPC